VAERRSATRRKISLPASAQECAASATIDAEPVITAATVLATAMSRLAPKATRTVTRLSFFLVSPEASWSVVEVEVTSRR
jgi:hypothetical protein